jgi:RNA polymerase sigma-70 factor (ECF subfamily)
MDEVLEAARSGDVDAIEALLAKEQDRIYRFGLRLCSDPEDAKDVLQETMIAVARSIRDYRGEASFSSWLFTIARSFCIKKRRKSKFAPEQISPLDHDVEATERRPDELAEARQIGAALDSAIRGLDDERREVLLLRDVEGLTAKEVAEAIGISVAAVKSRLHRARVDVRRALGPLLAPNEAPPRPGCPDVLSAYSKQLEGDIGPDLCAELERHLEACSDCRGRCDSLKETLSLCRTTPAATVPDDVQAGVRRAIRDFLRPR